MKPFLVIQLRPEDATADNEFAKILHYAGLSSAEVVRIRAEQQGLPAIDLATYSGIIVGGSPFDVSTPVAAKPPIQTQLEAEFAMLFAAVLSADFPFLGCCSGNGLLGHYLGVPVSRRYGESVGCVSVTLTTAGKEDALLAGLPETFAVLTGHKEACDVLPAEAVLLASNEQCPVQMFRVKNNIYATQFHPEGDAEGFAVRIGVYRHYGYFPAETAEQLIQTVAAANTPHAHMILQRFVARYKSH